MPKNTSERIIDRPLSGRQTARVWSGSSSTNAGGTTDSTTVNSILAAEFITLNADTLLTNERYLAVSDALTKTDGGAGAALTIGLTTPGTLSATSTNVATGAHTHAITASAAPGAAESLLKSTSAGLLTLPLFAATTSVTTPSLLSSGDLTITPAGGDIFANARIDVVTGTSGVTKSASYEGVAIYAASNAGLQLLTPNTGVGTITFGDPEDNDVGRILYRHSSNRMDFEAGATLAMAVTASGVGFGGQTSPSYTVDTTGTMRATTSLTTPLITTVGAGIDLTLQPADDIVFSPGSNIIKLSTSNVLQSDNYASQTTGMRITHDGQADFRYLFVDEMHAKSFIADLEQALAGGQIIAKSVTILYLDFTAPAAGGSTTLTVRDLPSATGMACFQNNDYIRLRKFSRSGGSLDISDCWGTVTLDTTYGTSGFDSATKTQRYTFTRSASPNAGAMTTGTVVEADAIVLDYGTSGNGFYEVNAIDGMYAVNSPYAQIVTWSSHPRTQTVRARLGNLYGIFASSGEYGLYAGGGTADTDQYLRLSNSAVRLNNIPLRMHNSGVQTVNIDSAGTNIWVGPSSADKRLYWDGSTLNVVGAITITGGNAAKTDFSNISATLDNVPNGSTYFRTTANQVTGAGRAYTALNSSNNLVTSVIPASAITPSGAGLYLGSNYMGYYDNSSWKTYIDSSGNMKLLGNASNNYIQWAAASNKLQGVGGGTEQWYADATNGKLYAGAGAVWMDVNGYNIAVEPVDTSPSNIRFMNGATVEGSIGYFFTAGPTPGASDGMNFYATSGHKFRFIGATSTEFSATVNVTGYVTATTGMSVNGTAVSLVGHTHSDYLTTSGGTLTGTLTARNITFATDSTYDIGAADKRVQDLYVANLHVNTIVGEPAYSHHHNASDIDVGTLDEARLPHTWTGALTMDADAAAGSSNYIRWLTQTSTVKAWDLIGRAWDYGTSSQQNDLLLTYTDNVTTYVVFQADSGTRVVDFLNTPTVGSTAVSLNGHTHDDRYYTETEVNSLLTGYVPTTRTVSAGSGLTGGGALSTNITLSHADTSSQTSVDNSGTTFIQDITLDAYGHITAIGSADIGTALDSRFVNVTGDTMTGLLTLSNSTDEMARLDSTSAAGSPFLSFHQAGTRRSFIQHADSADTLVVASEYGVISLRPGTAGAESETLQVHTTGATVTGSLTASTSVITPTITTSSGNLSVTSAGGTVAVTGALTGSSTGVFTSTLTAASDADAINTFGHVRLGYAQATDTATFSHFDHNSSTNFALAQNAAGASFVNGASGQTVDLQIAGVSQWSVNASRINPRSSVTVDIGDYNRRVRSLYAAELQVETLVAQNVMATIGGRIMVAPTVKLIADLANTGTATSFNTNLQSWWTLDEASGTRNDSRGSNSLTSINSVSSTTGKQSSAAVFTGASSMKLNRADNTSLSVGDIDFMFCAWIYPTLNSGARQTIICKGSTATLEYKLDIDWSASGAVKWAVWNSSGTSTEVTGGVVTVNAWHFICAYHDANGNAIGVAVNGSETNTSHTTGVRDGTGNFTLGARDTDQFYTGRIDEVGYWKSYIPDSHARSWLYNRGNGRTYSEVNTQVQSTIDVDGNGMAANDFAYMAAAPGGVAQIEAMRVYSSPSTIGGGYRYTVIRNYDGTGLNSWNAGDAVVNLGGNAGEGYIDITSTSTIHGELGPTIAIYQRTGSSVWDETSPTVALGNLRSFVDYASDKSGMAIGNDLTLTPATGFKGLTADATNGLRMFSTDIKMYNGATQTVNIDNAGTDVWIGLSSADKRISWNGTTLGVSGSITISAGSGFSGSGYLQTGSGTKDSTLNGFNIDGTEIVGQASGVDQVVLGTDGKIKAGAGNVILDSAGISVIGGSSFIIKQDAGTTKGYVYSSNPLDSLLVNNTGVGVKTAGVATTESVSLRANASGGRSSEIAIEATGSTSTNRVRLLAYSGNTTTSGQATLTETSFALALNGTGTDDFIIDSTSARFSVDVDMNSNDISEIGSLSVVPAVGTTAIYVGTPTNQTSAGLNIDSANTGTSFGPYINLGRNNNGTTPAAGFLYMANRGGTSYAVWVDSSGNLRIGTTLPTNAQDGSGAIVGTQSSSLDTKHIIEPFTDYGNALNAIIDAPLFDFTYKSGAYNNQRFTGIVTDYAPVFGMDRDNAHPAGKALNEVTAHGYTFAAIKALHSRIEQLENQVKELQHA